MRKNIYLSLILLMITCAYSQDKHYRVMLKDKGSNEFKHGSDLYNETLKLFSERAIERRLKVFDESNVISIKDAPLYQPYIDSIENLGVKVKLKLRWRNYIVVNCDSITADEIRKIDFVDSVQTTSEILSPLKADRYLKVHGGEEPEGADIFLSNCGYFDYGGSYKQVSSLGAIDVHSLGITGDGVLLGIIDNGFRWRNNLALAGANVVSEYDFVFLDSITSNQEFDPYNQDWHGTSVMSIISGYYPGKLIGIAPNTSLLLAKSEVMLRETRLEEDNLAAALEWLDVSGVDIVNISLGYDDLDSTDIDYPKEKFNGKSTIAAIAVNEAVKRGICVFTSAGNRGPGKYRIATPADADSAIAVAALEIDSTIKVAFFSSRGPRNDGFQKPDLAAMGSMLVGTDINSDDGFGMMFGTSYASPLTAGGAALVLSAFPELKPYELRKLLIGSATETIPNDSVGWGIPNIMQAMLDYGIVISPPAIYKALDYIRILPHVLSKNSILTVDLFAKFSNDDSFSKYPAYRVLSTNQFSADLPVELFRDKPAKCYLMVNDGISNRRYPFDESKFFYAEPDKISIPCGVDITALPKSNPNRETAYLYPSISNGGGAVELVVPVIKSSGISVEVYNLLGQLFERTDYPERNSGIANITLRTDKLISGSYFVKVSFSGKSDILGLVIVK